MTDEHNPEAEPTDLIAQAKGRAAFLRDRGEVKTPDLLEALAAKLAEAEAERDRVAAINVDHCRTINTYLVDNARLQDRAEAAEADLSRLRTAQDAMVGAVIKDAYALGFGASAEGWNGEYPTTDFRADPEWQRDRDRELAALVAQEERGAE